MASIYPRKGILQIKYKTKDGWKKKSTGLRDTPENRVLIKEEFLPALEVHLKQKVAQQLQEPIEYYINLYLRSKEGLATYWEIKSRVKIIEEAFKDRDIREIKVSEIRAWVMSFNVTPKTTSNYMTNFRGIFDIAIQEEVLDKNPFVHVSKPRSKEVSEEIEPFSFDEVKLILDNAPSSLKNFLAISFYTGMRSGEVLGLQIKDVKQGSIEVKRSVSKDIVTTPKTAKSIRSVPLLNVLKPYIQDQINVANKKKSKWLFSNQEGNHLYGIDSIRGKKPYGQWYKLLVALNLDYRKIYNTRHTFITAMLKSGILSVMEIAQIVGHSNSKMILERYAKFIKGEHLKIEESFDPFEKSMVTRGHIRGHIRGHTANMTNF